MGRPYDTEIKELPATYSWAMAEDVEALKRAVRESAPFPLLSIGSGGSLTAAHLHAYLHRTYAGQPASATTPFSAIASLAVLEPQSVWFVTAGGGNPDVVGALPMIARAEPRTAALLCLRRKSPAARVAREYEFVRTVEFEPPVKKDGFLATNSLLALTVLLARAYADHAGAENPFPSALLGFLAPSLSGKDLRALLKRDTLVVLCSPSTFPAGIDLESKFTEAALGHVQVSDFRNFAHGRHHWLAKRSGESAILALSALSDVHLAEKTLGLLPDVPKVHLQVPDGPAGALAALVAALQLVAFAGAGRGIDPGRPGVPTFGRRIYHLRSAYRQVNGLGAPDVTAIQRKERAAGERRGEPETERRWTQAYGAFASRISKAVFGGVVLDYDGTLCGIDERFRGIRPVVAAHLERLLSAGAAIGVATGRGKSAREDLRRKLPKGLWHSVVVGYYNGGDVATLEDDAHPTVDGTEFVPHTTRAALEAHPALSSRARITIRPRQVTIEPSDVCNADALYSIVSAIVQRHEGSGVSVVRSSHSIDVLAAGVSKRAVVERVRDSLAGDGRPFRSVLCIGDRGAWPGNDFALLDDEFALSVDEVSASPDTCWNLAPPGHRGIQATLDYLEAVVGENGRFRMCLRALSTCKDDTA